MKEWGVGDIVDGRYRLARVIAEGGAGTVFEARHVVTRRAVALKIPKGRWRGNAEMRERLVREAKALELVKHPNVVATLDGGAADDETLYLVLELLEGRSLQGLLAARQRLSTADTVAIGCQLCEALAAAHERGVVHRDVKPGNVFVAVDKAGRETLRLLDFGVATFFGAASGVADRKLTLEGALLGTAEYMAPEQLLGAADIDQRSDIYAAGVTLYECLAGTVPFEGTYGEVLLQATRDQFEPLCRVRPEVPLPLARAIERALARSRDDRFADAIEMRSALAAACGVDPAARTQLCVAQLVPGITAGSRGGEVTTSLVTGPAGAEPGAAAVSAVVQRRRCRRAPYVTPVTMRRGDGSTLLGRSEDVSEGGLLVLTAKLCSQGERVLLRFVLPGTADFAETAADLRWVRSGRGVAVAGCEFVELDRHSRETIREYVAELGTG